MAEAEPDLNEVARIANADVAMAATLIRNANGALYAGSAPVVSAGQAMNRLGLQPSAALMSTFLARHAIPVKSAQLAGFWEQSAQRARRRSPGSPRRCRGSRPSWRTATACSAMSACRC